LQDELTFVELRSQRGALHFGAQATSEKMASKLVRAIEQHASALSPQAHVPRRARQDPEPLLATPPTPRSSPLNLSTGKLIPLD
jgi:hypothetical protein